MKTSFHERLETELTLSGKAPRTVQTYSACVREFVEFGKVRMSRLGMEDVARFVVHLRDERRLAPSTVNIYVCALRHLFEVTLGRPKVVANLKAPRVAPALVVVLSPDEVVSLFDAFRKRVYRTLACLLYGTGLRISEALAVTVTDIDAARGVIVVPKTKGRRPRMVRLSSALLTELRSYWREVRPPGPLLFPGQDPRVPVNAATVQHAFAKAGREAGLTKLVTPHILRHTYATHLLESGVDIHTVQLLLGHANLNTTVRYLHVSTAHLAGRVTPLHPLLGITR